jgi:flagellar biosynthesis GTPase FlhF
MSSVRSVTLNDVAVPSSDTKTHIVIYHEKGENVLEDLRSEVTRLSALVDLLSTKVTQLESGAKTTPFFTAEVAPAPCGLDVWRISETPSSAVESEDISSKDVLQVLIQKLPATSMDVEREQDNADDNASAVAEAEEEQEEAEEEAEEEQEEAEEEQEEAEEEQEEAEEEQEEAEEEQEEAEEEQEEAEEEQEPEEEMETEEEVITFESIEYKGETYYKDPDGQVYQADADGDLDETPIGVWNEAKQKIQKYAKA